MGQSTAPISFALDVPTIQAAVQREHMMATTTQHSSTTPEVREVVVGRENIGTKTRKLMDVRMKGAISFGPPINRVTDMAEGWIDVE